MKSILLSLILSQPLLADVQKCATKAGLEDINVCKEICSQEKKSVFESSCFDSEMNFGCTCKGIKTFWYTKSETTPKQFLEKCKKFDHCLMLITQ